MTTPMRKKRAIPTHYSLQPPTPLYPETIATLQWKGIEVLTLTCPMLPSVNEKGKTGKRQWYIDDEYRAKEHIFQTEVTRQVIETNWTTSETDLYVIHYGFSFKNQTKQDYDGPLKPTQDCLQPPKPTEEEWPHLIDQEKYQQWLRAHPGVKDENGKYRRPKPTMRQMPKLANDQLFVLWRAQHPAAIYNDGQVIEASITKHINQPDPRLCVITIFKMDSETYRVYAREDPLRRIATVFMAL